MEQRQLSPGLGKSTEALLGGAEIFIFLAKKSGTGERVVLMSFLPYGVTTDEGRTKETASPL